MDLNSILSQLGTGSKDTVFLSVTPGVGLELIQLDISNCSVKNYSYRPLEYNESLREIANIEAFKNAVTELFAELHINLKSNVVLNLPMVLFGSKELPLLLADDAVLEALTSEVEQSYIFKRYEPVVSWVDASNSQSGDMRKLFYSAIQKNVVDDIKTALSELGIKLVGIEISLTSILKALAFSGLAEDEMRENFSWNLMVISQNGYSICSMIGKNIIEYYEEPLAIKSFEGDEIYNAINASVQITLMSYPANCLYVVSETDMVSAELLSKKIPFDGIVKFIDSNSFKKQDFIPVSLNILEDLSSKISLEAIGVASGNATNLPVKFNFMTSSKNELGEDPDESVHIPIGENGFDISPNAARNIAIGIAILIVIPALAIFLFLPVIQNKKQTQLDEINSKLEQTNSEIKKIEEEQNRANNFDVNSEIKKVLGYNRDKLISYSALGESVPQKLYITYFVAKDDGKVDIKGSATNVEDIYAFFRNIKDSLINTQLRLQKLEMKSKSVDDAVSIDPAAPSDYEFEITNMNAAELNTDDAKKSGDQNQQQQNNNNQQAQNQPNNTAASKPLLKIEKGNN